MVESNDRSNDEVRIRELIEEWRQRGAREEMPMR